MFNLLSKLYVLFLIFFVLAAPGCKAPNSLNDTKREANPNFKNHWYSGQAEISSFKLSQARYGELRDGTASLVFVTEPYSPALNTKPNNSSGTDIPVLKLNMTKKFNTGIYPYSMMNSTFYPLTGAAHSVKISSSSQEWCGHTYMELVNDRKFEIQTHSYFEGESSHVKLDKSHLEDDIWSQIRVASRQLPLGNFQMIPSFFYTRLMHKKLKAYDAIGKIEQVNEETKAYSIQYPELDRVIQITYQSDFPHQILGWSETYQAFNGESLTTTAKRIKVMKIDYWNKNSNKDSQLRKELGL